MDGHTFHPRNLVRNAESSPNVKATPGVHFLYAVEGFVSRKHRKLCVKLSKPTHMQVRGGSGEWSQNGMPGFAMSQNSAPNLTKSWKLFAPSLHNAVWK